MPDSTVDGCVFFHELLSIPACLLRIFAHEIAVNIRVSLLSKMTRLCNNNLHLGQGFPYAIFCPFFSHWHPLFIRIMVFKSSGQKPYGKPNFVDPNINDSMPEGKDSIVGEFYVSKPRWGQLPIR